MELSGDREFRYPLRPGRLVVFGLFVLVGLVGVLLGLLAVMAGLLDPSGDWHVWGFLALVGVGLALGLVPGVWGLVGNILLCRRGYVLVTRVGITVAYIHRREEHVFWEQVEELRSGYPDSEGATLVLIAEGRSVPILRGLADRDELRDEIVARAGLVRADETLVGERYIRPEGA